MPDINFLANKSTLSRGSRLLDFAGSGKVDEVLGFHRAIRGYSRTPLVGLNDLAQKLGVCQILIKDESFRFGLNAFKVLGASYAIARTLGIKTLEQPTQQRTLVTATDGNHGRAVAWVAQRLGIDSLVFIPEGAHPSRVDAIKICGADVKIGGVNYEAAIEKAIEASEREDHLLIQDTAWDGYEQLPEFITQGYFTLVSEFADQHSGKWPTHVFVQAGVGSLAAGIIGAFYSYPDKPIPRFVIVEPKGAACVYESAQRGKLHTIEGRHKTIMECLSCGRASSIAWELIKCTADAFVACDDEVTEIGIQVLANPTGVDRPVFAGESGAVTTGLLHEVLSDRNHARISEALGLDSESVVLLYSTEGSVENLL